MQHPVGSTSPVTKPSNYSGAQSFPFASVSVLVIIGTLFSLSMIWGGWTWSSWTYAFAFLILVPLVILETKRKVVITGAAMIMLFFMVLIDAGMPGYLGYSTSDYSWYDNIAHFLGAFVLTMFLWAFIWWTLSPNGPPSENGARRFVLTIAIMVTVSFVFEFTEYFSDILFGWANFHPGIDTVGDLIFDLSGVITAALVVGRHRTSALKRPFWHASGTPSG
jgi:cbb3-type cytochrome oxidase subunit 3